jgi:hypothetical protein
MRLAYYSIWQRISGRSPAASSAASKKIKSTCLTVARARREDIFRDIARVHWQFRMDDREGEVCRVSVGERQVYLSMRGLETAQPLIRIDELTRYRLGLQVGDIATFEIRRAGILAQLHWALRAADRATRISVQLAILSVILGLLGLFLGIVALSH